MAKLCRLWPGYVNYGNFLNKLIIEKIKKFYCPKNFNKTPLGETGCLGNLYFLLTGCLGIQFFDLPPVITQSVRPLGYLPLTVQHLCHSQDIMPCHWSPSASHPTLITLGKQKISLGVASI